MHFTILDKKKIKKIIIINKKIKNMIKVKIPPAPF